MNIREYVNKALSLFKDKIIENYYSRSEVDALINAINQNVIDSGWVELDLLGNVETYSEGSELRCRKIGNLVYIEGAVKNITATNTEIATLPEQFAPTRMSKALAMPGTNNRFNRFIVSTNQKITFQYTSHTGTLSASDWYPINISYMVD